MDIDGARRALKRGDTFAPGDTVVTREGRTQLRFSDGGRAALQPNTEYLVEDYHFEGVQDGTEKTFVNLVRGSVRLVMGLIGKSNRQNFLLRTSVATIGIRGTAGKVSHCDVNCGVRGPGTSLAGYDAVWDLNSGAFSGPVAAGEAKFCDGASCIDIPGFGQRQDASKSEEEEEEEEEEGGADDGGADELSESKHEGGADVGGAINIGTSPGADGNDGLAKTTGPTIRASGAEQSRSIKLALPLVTLGEQTGESGKSCDVFVCGDNKTPLEVLYDKAIAAIFDAANDNLPERTDDSADDYILFLNNGFFNGGLVLQRGYIQASTNDPLTFREALSLLNNRKTASLAGRLLDEVRPSLISLVASRPAQIASRDYGYTDDGLLLKGRFSRGYLLNFEGSSRTGNLYSYVTRLSKFQSIPFIFGPQATSLPSSNVATYYFTGGTYSTGTDGASIGKGVTEGALTFYFESQTGAIDMTVSHDRTTYSVLGALGIKTGNSITFYDQDNSVFATTDSQAYPVDIDGFFSGNGRFAPLAAGLTYEIQTDTRIRLPRQIRQRGDRGRGYRRLSIIGAAGFGQESTVNPVTSAAADDFYIAASGAFTDSALRSQLWTGSFGFQVSASGASATIEDGLIRSFEGVSTGSGYTLSCSPTTCSFDTNGVSPIVQGADRELGVSWARFAPGYGMANEDTVQGGQLRGSAHLVSIATPTDPIDIPAIGSGKIGTYNIISGDTGASVIFEHSAVLQEETTGNLDSASLVVNFNDGSIAGNISGSFPDGASGGSWSLSGSSTEFDRDHTNHYVGLSGTVTSPRITNISASSPNCSNGCVLDGETHFNFAGSRSPTAVAGSLAANTRTGEDNIGSRPEVSVSAAYFLRGTVQNE